MCDPVSVGMFAVQAAGHVAQDQQGIAAAKGTNRARLKAFDAQNQDYLTKVMADNNAWKNDVIVQEIEQEDLFQSMVDQWEQVDQQLDQIFSANDFKLQDAIQEMYQNEYAGTGTGRTAARLAGKSAKELGFKKAVLTQELSLKKEEAELKKEGVHTTQSQQASKLWEKVRFPPQHGQTPLPPPMVAAPSQASLMLNIAGSALQAYGFHKMTGAKDTGMQKMEGWVDAPQGYEPIGDYTGLDPTTLPGGNVDIVSGNQGGWVTPPEGYDPITAGK